MRSHTSPGALRSGCLSAAPELQRRARPAVRRGAGPRAVGRAPPPTRSERAEYVRLAKTAGSSPLPLGPASSGGRARGGRCEIEGFAAHRSRGRRGPQPLRRRRCYADPSFPGSSRVTTFAASSGRNSTTNRVRDRSRVRRESGLARTSSGATCVPRASLSRRSRAARPTPAPTSRIGLISTDAIYFAVGHYGFDGGIMITASHNPAQYNGLKFTREAIAISIETGLAQIRDRIAGEFEPAAARRERSSSKTSSKGSPSTASRSSTTSTIKPFKIAIDAGNGMAGKPCRACSPAAVRGRPDVLRTRRHVPESSGEPDRTREHGRPAARRARERLRPRRRVRRRCRPHVPRRREGRPDRRRHRHRARRHQHAQAPSRREDPLQPDLQPQRARSDRTRPAAFRCARKSATRSSRRRCATKTSRSAASTPGISTSAQLVRRLRDDRADAVPQRLQRRAAAGSEVIAPIDTRFRSGEVNSRVDDIPGRLRELEADHSRCARSTISTASRSSTRTGG